MVERHRNLRTLFVAPPDAFLGSQSDWNNGANEWINLVDESLAPKAVAEREEQKRSVTCYFEDMLVEPGCLCFCERYKDLFAALYDAYVDQHQVKVSSCGEMRRVPHLTFASFFRFCVDFRVFPMLCSYEEMQHVYSCAVCI